ncbi:CoA-binding protein [Pigmentiphaga litoralis]|jgi:acyl-CoA synthetase (NDP forming)|uniref:acetate--CoA ligase family protein n=1 Tax=Pigmentiphaga litoralis TaxID=516702 RepID=UPI001678FEAD|nr:acetate--CoA ligase family protein [Pigmentiphaga litoralis]GGX07192.1 CoA-binding protein [Pigmentiphaga litoralis]
MTRNALERLLRPRSIAVVGASPEPASVSGLLLTNIGRFDYGGDLHLVSRSRDEVNGRPCLKSIDDLPEGVDAAVLVVPQVAVYDSVEACGKRGVGGAIIFASGFSELGDEGRAAQDRLADMARGYGMALLGPNCMGFVNYSDNVPLTFEPVPARKTMSGPKVAIIAQSGAMNGNLRAGLTARGVNVSFSLSTGNEAVTSAEDLLSALIDADDVDAFAIFVEMLRKPALFLQAVARARALGKPVVLMHPGRSQRAREAAQSHTGALAGDYQVMRTLVEREGVVVVDTLDELFDVTAILARYPVPIRSGKAAVSSNSGALRGVAIDFCEDIGMELATLSPQTLTRINEILPDFVTADNPLDLTSQGMQRPEIFGLTAQAILDDPEVGSLIVPLMGGSPAQQVAKANSLLPVMIASQKPVAFCIMGDTAPLAEEFTRLVTESGMPFGRSPDRALRAMAHVHRYGQLSTASSERAQGDAGRKLPDLVPGPLVEYRGKAWLRDLGIQTPDGDLATSVDEALAVADRIGYPVVLKAQAAQLMHKSDVGGVAVNVRDADALRDAWSRMQDSIAAKCPGLALDGILVEAMSRPGLELVIGGRRDANWGVVMLVGLGGIWIEALHDVKLLPPDLTVPQIVAAMHTLKGAKLLSGLRGKGPVDVQAVAQAVSRLAALMLANPEITEIDVNPLIALPEGEGVIALDALFVM